MNFSFQILDFSIIWVHLILLNSFSFSDEIVHLLIHCVHLLFKFFNIFISLFKNVLTVNSNIPVTSGSVSIDWFFFFLFSNSLSLNIVDDTLFSLGFAIFPYKLLYSGFSSYHINLSRFTKDCWVLFWQVTIHWWISLILLRHDPPAATEWPETLTYVSSIQQEYHNLLGSTSFCLIWKVPPGRKPKHGAHPVCSPFLRDHTTALSYLPTSKQLLHIFYGIHGLYP